MKVSKKFPNLLLAVALVLFLAGVSFSGRDWFRNKQAVVQAQKDIARANSGQSSPAPATVKPTVDDIASYTVGPTLPRYMIIPKLGVKARVRALGVTKDNQIQAPSNVHDTGWYNGSSLPGKPGAMLIDGHVSSWTTNGVFYDIKKLQSGDTLQVQRGDGTVFTYKVVKTHVYDADNVDMTAVLGPVTNGKPGLNLITCDGTVKSGTNEFTQRIVVFAVQV